MTRSRVLAYLGVVVCMAAPAAAQTTFTYHLHNEQTISYDGRDLRAEGPDTSAKVLATAVSSTMVGTTTWMRIFQLPSGEPIAGQMPAGTVVTFSLWMRLTEARGTIYPTAGTTNMFPGGWSGSTGPYLHYCSAVGAAPLTTAFTRYTFECTIEDDFDIDPTDRFTLWVGFLTHSYTPAKGKKGGISVELGIEGTLDGATDSTVAVTLP